MKTTIDSYDFIKAFEELRPDNFTRAGLNALFDYLEEFEADTGHEMELDVIAICCDFTEYETALEAANEHCYEPEDDGGVNGGENEERAALEYLQDNTQVIQHDSGIIIQNW